MKKKSQIWVSAVLYIALGLVIITLILSAGVPMINKIRDKNTITQSKKLMFDIHENIEAVINEAKGSARFLSPVDINSGELVINDVDDRVEWSMLTKNEFMVNDTVFTEGDLYLLLENTATEGEYEMNLYLDYSARDVNLSLVGEYGNPFQGKYSFSIKNMGYENCTAGECLGIQIEVT